MARRSARLQKRSPTPSESSSSSWETAQSNNSPDRTRLAAVHEVNEQTTKTPRNNVEEAAPAEKAKKPSQLPKSKSKIALAASTPTNRTPIKPADEEMHPAKHHASTTKPLDEARWLGFQAMTPHKPVAHHALAENASQLPQPKTAAAARTPKNRTPLKAPGEEMHPAHHHPSTAKVLDEARWLGFQALGAHTAPPKASGAVIGQATPSKTPVPTSPSKLEGIIPSSPESRFRFRFRSPLSGLSPMSKGLLKERKDPEADARALFKADEFTTPADMSSTRKTAVPKGKMSRFSEVHMKEFKKMDSIANHPSAFRADPNRFKPVHADLKKSSSKMDLNKQEQSQTGANKLKRTQSKMDLTDTTVTAPATSLKRTQSKMDVTETNTRIPPTPLKRTQSKMDVTHSNLPRAHSTVRLVPPTRDGRPQTQDGNPFAKRVKRTEADDAATTRPASRDGQLEASKAVPTPARKITSQTALPRLAARLMTPTKASLARSQSAKAIKSTSMTPSLFRSPSVKGLFSPTNIRQTVTDSVRESFRKTSNSLHRVRSILRTPSRKFSDDLEKVAAGTHMSPPPGLNLQKALPQVPATAPVKKHVNFTNSTLERAAHDELGKSPSPMKFRAGSEVPSGAVIYPTLRAGVEYPALPDADEPPASPSRRLTFGGATENTPDEFSFKSDKPINFGPASTGTIRMVRKSNASSLFDGKKRKLDTLEESSDKENTEPAQDEGRSPKKMRPTPAEPPKTPSSVSKLPRRTPKRGSSISKSRLAFLATPRRGKA